LTKDIQGEGLAWQVATWNQMANLYASENAPRLEPVAERVIFHADLNEGEAVLGTGTGLVPQLASISVGLPGDIAVRGLSNITFDEGGAELIPTKDGAFDVMLASLNLMFVVDRAAAARKAARVLHPGGRFVGQVWTRPV
jgi:SAM-dependent methyltransferase